MTDKLNERDALSDEQIEVLWLEHLQTHTHPEPIAFARAIEAAVLSRATAAAEPEAWLTADGRESCTAGDKEAWLQQPEMHALAAEHCIPLYAHPVRLGRGEAAGAIGGRR